MPIPGDGIGSSKGEGKGDRGKVGGVEGLEGRSGKQARFDKKKLLEEVEAQMEALKKVLKDKEDEISKSKKQLYQAKEDVIKEYHDSDALLTELGSSFADGFNDCLRQVRAAFPDLDLSHITIDVKAKTPTQLVNSESTNKLFVDDTTVDPQGDGETAHKDQAKSVGDVACPLEGNQTVEGKDEENPMDQQ